MRDRSLSIRNLKRTVFYINNNSIITSLGHQYVLTAFLISKQLDHPKSPDVCNDIMGFGLEDLIHYHNKKCRIACQNSSNSYKYINQEFITLLFIEDHKNAENNLRCIPEHQRQGNGVSNSGHYSANAAYTAHN